MASKPTLDVLIQQYRQDSEIAELSAALRERLGELTNGADMIRTTAALQDALFPLGSPAQKPTPSAANDMPGLNHQQAEAVSRSAGMPVFNIRALAGTGKSTVLRGIAEDRSGRGLLIAYNTQIANHAARTFPRAKISARTWHSLAYEAMRPAIQSSGKALFEPTLRQIVEYLGLTSRQKYRVAKVLRDALGLYCCSADAMPGPQHFARANFAAGQSTSHLEEMVYRLWTGMFDAKASLNMSPDAYLKAWVHTCPTLNADYILVDEAQDTTAIAMALLSMQDAPVVYAGDQHQAIYAYRGTMDALASSQPAASANLSVTYRCGPVLAAVANKILEAKGVTERLEAQGGYCGALAAPDTSLVEFVRGHRTAYIARTNADLIDMAITYGPRFRTHLTSNLNEIAQSTQSAYALWKGNLEKVTDPSLRGFADWASYVDWSESGGDAESKRLVDIITRHGDNLPMLIAGAAQGNVGEAEAQLVLTTAHASKGREFDHVWMADDYRAIRKADGTIDTAEANILYVASTRARHTMRVTSPLWDALNSKSLI